MIWLASALLVIVGASFGFLAGGAWVALSERGSGEAQREIESLRASLTISRRIISDQKALIEGKRA